MAAPAWDTYAAQMYHLGHGYPLWTPDPCPGAGEVEVGAVGYIFEGEFTSLFNCLKGQGEGQPRGNAPVDHVTLDVGQNERHGINEEIASPLLLGRGLRRVQNDSDTPDRDWRRIWNNSGTERYRFECKEDEGAFLLLDAAAVTHITASRSVISAYMREHIQKWVDYANCHLELGLVLQQLMFVSGTVKTRRWAVATFQGELQGKFGSVSPDLSSRVPSFDIEDAALSFQHSRAGPTSRRAIAGVPGWTCDDGSTMDQCVFVHYYKMKHRSAQVGDQDAEGYDDMTVVDEMDDFEQDTEGMNRGTTDPTNAVLDYVLENSDAQYALCSDMDVYDLFELHGSAHDIGAQLLAHNIPIHVDENGVGQVCISGEIQDDDDGPTERTAPEHIPFLHADAGTDLHMDLRTPTVEATVCPEGACCATGLSSFLAGPLLKWDLRETRAESLVERNAELLILPAFESIRRHCTLRFVLDGQPDLVVSVSAAPHPGPLTVWDVLLSIDDCFYSELDDRSLFLGNDRYAGATDERPRRMLGDQDVTKDVFRYIDLFPEGSHSCFHGLSEQRVGTQVEFVVVMGGVL